MSERERKIVIVGPGAMGCLFAGLLDAPGREVWLLDKDAERAALIAKQGVIVESGGARSVHRVRVTSDPHGPGAAGLIVICVKAYDTAHAAERSRPLAGPDTLVLSLQNGLGNVETLVRIFGPDRALGGTTAQGANLVAPGHVRHAGRGETVIGEPGAGVKRADKIAALFHQSGIETATTNDLEALIWSKLVINAAINPLTAILGVKNGALPGSAAARELMARAVDETVKICDKKGIRLLFPDPLEKALAVARATAENISSMLADVRARKRTEIREINGAVAREAAALAMSAPANATLAQLVSALEETYAARI
ncbi:MAG TPA: 2-dehydropantoate 2-reductase [bacterium]|nr:2-dehydropantoate 2-reductase [bacterium]